MTEFGYRATMAELRDAIPADGIKSSVRKIANNTIQYDLQPGGFAVTFHETEIYRRTSEYILLNSGGYKTVTTKGRLSSLLNPDKFIIYADRGVWYLRDISQGWNDDSAQCVFADGMSINLSARDVNYNGSPPPDPRELSRLRKRAKKYAAGFLAALSAGKIDKPSAGDCWYCALRTESGRTLGEESRSSEHLISHMDESYYVPSLLLRACETFGVSIMAKHYIACKLGNDSSSDYLADIIGSQIQSSIFRYILRGLGLGG